MTRFSAPRWMLLSLLTYTLCSVSASAAEPTAAADCKPILKVTGDIANLPCGGTIQSRNELGALTSEEAIFRARVLLWQRYKESRPCFINLELVSKEGLRNRFVYSLRRKEKGGELLVSWRQSEEVQRGPGQKAEWTPLQEVSNASIKRDESDGSLLFTKDGRLAGKL